MHVLNFPGKGAQNNAYINISYERPCFRALEVVSTLCLYSYQTLTIFHHSSELREFDVPPKSKTPTLKSLLFVHIYHIIYNTKYTIIHSYYYKQLFKFRN